MGHAKLLLYIMGERRCVGVRCINAATPILYMSDFVYPYAKSLLYNMGVHIQIV